MARQEEVLRQPLRSLDLLRMQSIIRPVAQHREDAYGEGDVRGGGDSPAVCGHRAVVERREENRRDQHAARSGQHRKDGPARGRKLPADDLALDLKPHGKEENHHQPVVDELLDGHAPREDPVDHTVRGMDHQREVGLPGETIQIHDGKVYINGSVLEDDVSEDDILTAGLAAGELTLGENEYFVLGDNRNNSEDSRFANVGVVKKDDIVGSVWFIASPMKRMRLL